MSEVFVPRLAISTEPLIAKELYVSGDGVDWSKIPGDHTSYFLNALSRHVYSGMDWVFEKDMVIRKLKGDEHHPLIITGKDFQEGEHRLKIRLSRDMPCLIVEIDGRRRVELPVRMEHGKIMVYGISDIRPETFLNEETMNRLLWWGDLKLLDYIANPLNGEDDGAEVMRNITLRINIGRLVKKFTDCKTKVPYGFRKAVLRRYVSDKYQRDLSSEMVEDNADFSIEKSTHVAYHGELKNQADYTIADTLRAAFQLYLDSPLGPDDMDSSMAFKFTPEGTNYEISFLFNGTIKRIKVLLPNDQVPTAEQIIELSEWANRELLDIVEKAGICKKIEETYEPDTDTNITEVCSL